MVSSADGCIDNDSDNDSGNNSDNGFLNRGL
jgi:hypothetical protein